MSMARGRTIPGRQLGREAPHLEGLGCDMRGTGDILESCGMTWRVLELYLVCCCMAGI